jgi:hypothetical protein
MRFNFKQKKVKSPKIGDIKQKVRFAFLPTRINKNTVVWLEKYVNVYEYSKSVKFDHWEMRYAPPISKITSFELKLKKRKLYEKSPVLNWTFIFKQIF